jgi:hypothetical protein
MASVPKGFEFFDDNKPSFNNTAIQVRGGSIELSQLKLMFVIATLGCSTPLLFPF